MTPGDPDVCEHGAGEALPIAYARAGRRGAGADIVLINGIGGAPGLWKPVRDRLARDRAVWQPHHRGLAPSSVALLEVSPERLFEQLVDDLELVVTRLVERPAVIVAWSGGAKLAAALAARVPERIAGLCCVSGAFRRGDGERSLTGRLAPLVARLSSGAPVPAALIERIVELIAVHAEPPRPALLADLVEREGAGFAASLFRAPARPGGASALAFPALRDAASIVSYLRLIAALAAVDVEPLLARTRVPLLFVAGAGDRIVGAEASRRIAAAAPGAVYVELADATHYAILEQPDAVAGAIARWLDAALDPAGSAPYTAAHESL